MTDYTHILAAVDISDVANTVIKRAQSLAKVFNARISLIHVIEPLVMAYGGDIPLDFTEIQSQIHNQVTEKLQRLAQEFQIAEANIFIETGSREAEIIEVAQKIRTDLIVAGIHTRHGLGLLFGSTVGGVVKRAPCDVLAVHVV